jgi:DNA polymerase elongation subunit (family B)
MYYTHYSRRGNNILIRYKKPNDSNTYSKVVDFYKPSLFTSAESQSEWQTIYGENVKKVEFENVKSAKAFADQYKNLGSMNLSGNSNYENQFIIELFDGKQPDYEDANIRLGFVDIEVLSPDEFPKPSEAKHPINAVTIYDSVEKTYYTFGLEFEGCGGYDLDLLEPEDRAKVENLNVEYFPFNTEIDLVRNLLQHISDRGYDCISGWNSEGFDVPYIINRAYKILGKAQTKRLLSPFNMIDQREFMNSFGQEQETFTIIGLPHLDYLQMYKKHTFITRESYKLDFIGQEELGEKKLSHDEETSLATLYKNNYPKFIAYNIVDVDLMVRLEDKLSLFGLTYAMAYYSLSNFVDTLGTVKIWEQLAAKFLYTKGKVPPFKKDKVIVDRDFEGAYVKEPIKGFHDWVVSFDLNGLYPHLIQQWNIGNETIVSDPHEELLELRERVTFDQVLNKEADVLDVLKSHNVTMTPNKEFYRLDTISFLSEIMRELYETRKEYKKKMLECEQLKVDSVGDKKKVYEFQESKFHNLQMGIKILANGGYGALGQKSFLYYKVENAEAITMSGQLVNKWTSGKIDNFLKLIFNMTAPTWIYSDTDSMYLTIKPFVDTLNISDRQKLVDTIDQFCKEVISPKIEEYSNELCEYLNCYEQRMFWAREVISDRAIWIGKKKYVMSVLDSEGTRYKEPKIKITGMESVKSSTPAWSRKFLKDIYIIGLYKDEAAMHDYLEGVRSQFDLMDISDIAIPSGINEVQKYVNWETGGFMKGAPKHVKAAITYNNMIEKHGLIKLQKITGGERIKYIELLEPNPAGHETIAFDGYLPEEFKLEKYIDADAIYEKSFIKPLRIFIKPIGWKEERSIDMFSF